MRTFVATAAAVAMAFVCPAYGETQLVLAVAGERGRDVRLPDTIPDAAAVGTPMLKIGSPSLGVSIPRASLLLTPGTGMVRGRLQLVIESMEQGVKNAETSLTLPAGARVVGLAVTLGSGARMVGTALAADDALGRYERLTHERTDPGLLAFDRSVGGEDRYLVRVYPLGTRQQATVDIDLELPPADALAIDSTQTIAAFTVDVAGTRSSARLTTARTIAIPTVREGSAVPVASEAVAVDERVSLFVDEPPGARPRVTIGPVFGCGIAHSTVTVDKRTIRTEVKRHVDQLRYCYSRELQQRPTLAGSVALHFALVPDGSVQDVSVDGDLDSDEVKRCMTEQVSQWRFHEHDDVVQVNYPLTLVNGY